MGHKSSRIDYLPMLMTAAHLICGFAAVLSVLRASPGSGGVPEEVFFGWAIFFIMAAGVFDFLDGQCARLCGRESAFGRELDSLADMVSFGVAPAALVYRILLTDRPVAGSVIAAISVLSCALRLARFNTGHPAVAIPDKGRISRGLPAPMTAGGITSLTWFSLELPVYGREVVWNWLLPLATVFCALLMLSSFRYPAGTGRRTLLLIALILVVIAGGITQYRWLPPLMLFLVGATYAIVHPCLSIKRWYEVDRKKAASTASELRGATTPPSTA
jgi:CDP-diacylglycerol---serine O-phosphatidyltransferase